MSAQGPLPPDDFGLIETLLWTREAGYWLAEGHRARISRSASELGFAFSPDAYEKALAQACAEAPADALRVRLELRRGGETSTKAVPFAPPPPDRVWRVAVAATRLNSQDDLLRHKTTRRAIYEDALTAAQAEDPAVDEVLFLNERGEICEGARTSLFLLCDGILLTPPLSSGLLAGVLRGDLLSRGEAREHIIAPGDLTEGFLLGNALRGKVRARLRA